MTILRWIGGIVVFFWLLGLVFSVGGKFINILLIVAAIIFICDIFFGKKDINKHNI